jgi:tetratricopeptide (TPR) repeat protein
MNEPEKAVFLSYTSQDSEAARRICNALREAGIEVWFDQSELRGGDVWDAAIRKQIKTCALFLPIISANTTARAEGYFRLEWKLAVDRSHLMASNKTFLLPIVIDDTQNAVANVPDRFREVQWISLRGGEPTAAFAERVSLLIAHHGLSEAGKTPTDASGLRPALSPTPQRTRRAHLWIGAALLVALIGAAWVVKRRLAEPARVVPYSIEDRRMSFALLPLQAADDDATETQIAKATGAQAFVSLEADHIWANLAPQASVARALGQTAVPREVAKALNVHFLVRGNVSRAASGYTVKFSTVDGETERVLGNVELAIPPGSLTPKWDDEIDDATGTLVFYGLQVEEARAKSKPDSELDVRDLTYRAWLEWGRKRESNDDKGAYSTANTLLKRALSLAPDDPLALALTVKVNLCDCIQAWSTNIAEQQAIAENAIERYLILIPDSAGMQQHKATIYRLRGRYDDELIVLDKVLSAEPRNYDAMEDKARALLKLGRPKEAAMVAAPVYERHPNDWSGITALIAAIDFVQADYAGAVKLAQKSATQMSQAQLRNPEFGAVRLTLIAAAAHLHDSSAAAAGISDLQGSVPTLTTLSSIRKWIHPHADLYGYEPLFDGLRLAGLHD